MTVISKLFFNIEVRIVWHVGIKLQIYNEKYFLESCTLATLIYLLI